MNILAQTLLGATQGAGNYLQQQQQQKQRLSDMMMQEQLKNQMQMKKFSQIQNLIYGNQGEKLPSEEFSESITVSKPPSVQQRAEFQPAELSDEKIIQATLLDPTLGRVLAQQKDVALREKKSTPDYQRQEALTVAQAKADIEYNKDLQQAAKTQYLKSETLNNLDRLNKKGVTGKAYEKALEKFGLVSLTSSGRREFAGDVKNLITDVRSILGGQFSNFEFQTVLQAYPSADFSKEANEAIIRNLKNFQDIRNQEFKIANDLKKENKGKIPEDFNSKVNERLNDYVNKKMQQIKKDTETVIKAQYNVPPGHTLLLAPDGEMMAVPDNEVSRLLELGAMHP